jgi:ribosomal protein L29
MKFADLKNNDSAALQKIFIDCKRDLMAMRFQSVTGGSVKMSNFRLTKKTIARIKTLQTMMRTAETKKES